MLTIKYHASFKDDYRRIEKKGYDIGKLDEVVRLLTNEQPLPERYTDYPLVGNYIGCRACHITSDWLLIYEISHNELLLLLTRTGSRADLLLRKGEVMDMLTQNKYSFAFAGGTAALSAIAMLSLGIYSAWFIGLCLFPVLAAAIGALAAKHIGAGWPRALAVIAGIACYLLFWGHDQTIRRHLYLDAFSVTAAVFAGISLLCFLTFQRLPQNGTFGIRMPLALKYEAVWSKAHHACRVVITAFLPAQIAVIFYTSGWTRFTIAVQLLLIPLFFGALYSEIIGKPYFREEKRIHQAELRAQIKKEEGGYVRRRSE